jgi:hypothetical protein
MVELTQRDEKKKTQALPANITTQLAVGSNAIRLVASSLIPHVAQVVSARRIAIETMVQSLMQRSLMDFSESRYVSRCGLVYLNFILVVTFLILFAFLFPFLFRPFAHF